MATILGKTPHNSEARLPNLVTSAPVEPQTVVDRAKLAQAFTDHPLAAWIVLLGSTQKEVAEMVGMRPQHLNRYIRTGKPDLTVSRAISIVEVLRLMDVRRRGLREVGEDGVLIRVEHVFGDSQSCERALMKHAARIEESHHAPAALGG
jgi:hypothetical protein